MTRKGKLTEIFKQLSFSAETVPKINIVIPSEAKNLLFHHFLKRRDPSVYGLRTRKGKLTRILEHAHFLLYKLKETWENII
jgi:hypothetical protein